LYDSRVACTTLRLSRGVHDLRHLPTGHDCRCGRQNCCL
ncbi:hypothetical protein LSAT2_017630, partial [Lamellibrachia satsuma]